MNQPQATRAVDHVQIDVLMPVHNAQRYLREAVASILRQSFGNFRLICVDDGSTDESANILKQLAASDSRMIVIEQSNQGVASALNCGLEACNAPLIARMDADDIAMPDRLKRQLDFLLRNPCVVAVGSAIMEIDTDNDPLSVQTFAQSTEQIVDRMLQLKTGLAHPAAMIRRKSLNELGGYDPTFNGVEDVDLWFRLATVGQLANLPEVLLCYRQHDSSVCWSENSDRGRKLVNLMKREHQRRGSEISQTLVNRCLGSRSIANPMKWARLASRNGRWNTALKHVHKQWGENPWSRLTWRMTAEVMLRLIVSLMRHNRDSWPEVPYHDSSPFKTIESRAA